MVKNFFIRLSVITGLFSLACIATAQTTEGGLEQVKPSSNVPSQPRAAREFGLASHSKLQIGSVAFRPRTAGATLNYFGSGTSTANTAGSYDHWAPVNLPSGAKISYVDLFACDNNASGARITAVLTRYAASAALTVTDLGAVSSVQGAGSGCQNAFMATGLGHTVSNDQHYYAINLRFNAADASNRIHSVSVWWNRQASPSPVVASFSDVPTGHFAFQFVEALAASGITTGCGASNFCPNDTVTRAQMAIFLGRALGLHWPN